MSNGQYSVAVSQTGSGRSVFHQHFPTDVVTDVAGIGRTIFIRDNDSGEYWSVGHHPGGRAYDTFQATHSPGSSLISSSAQKIDSTVTFFVPTHDPCEVWQINLRNGEKKKRRLSIFVYFELPNIAHCDTALKNNCLFINSKHQPTDHLYYFGLSNSVDSFDTDREFFIGPYRTVNNPRALEDGKCSRSQATTNPIAVLQRNITLGSAAASELVVIVGAQEIEINAGSYTQAKASAMRRAETILEKYRRVHGADKALEEVKKSWQHYEEKFSVKTPDESLNVSQNYWAKYQNIIASQQGHRVENTANFAKQLVTISALGPPAVEEKLRVILARQLKDGRTLESVDLFNNYARVSDQTDGPAWLILATTNYICETGNKAFLKENISYFDGGSGNVLEHLIRAAKHCLAERNERFLIEEHGHESTAKTGQVIYALKELLPILSATGEHDLTRNLQQKIDDTVLSFNRRMWDGSWYIAKRNSRKIGSKKNPERKIDLEAQVWAIIAGLASTERSEKAMNMAWRQTGSPAGLTTFQPPYSKYDGENPESVDGAGVRQNGGVNVSLAALAMLCEAKLGRGDLVYKIFQQHSFAYLSENQENYKIAPFVYPAFIFGPASSKFGRGDGAWEKNPSGWMWKIILEYCLGAQPVLGGLKIDPCIPRDWRQVEFSRSFRGAEYHIRILNPTRQTKGVERVMVDGIRQAGNVVQPFQTGVHYIEVFLG